MSTTTTGRLAEIRKEIDGIDDKLIPLLVARIDLALQASEHKNSEVEIRGCDRVQIVLDKAANRANDAGGHAETVVSIYRSIVNELTELQLRKKGH